MIPFRSRHVIELDGLRGLAVIMVLGWHFLGSMMDRSSVISEFIYAATIFGRTGVDLFFVLSGFLIIGIVSDERDNPNLFRTFYARRLLRIHPPYLALILLYWICYATTGPNAAFNAAPALWVQVVAQLTFTWNWLMARYNDGIAAGFSVTWSVAIEEWFYLIFPAVIVASPRKLLPRVLIFTALLSAFGRAIFYLVTPEFYLAPYVLMPFRLDGLAIGGLLALAYRDDTFWKCVRAKRAGVWNATVACTIATPILVGLLRDKLPVNMYTWGHAYLALTGCLMITSVLLFEGSSRLRILRSSLLRGAGKISYTLYLVHPLALSLLFVLAGRREFMASVSDVVLAASALLIAIVFSWLSYRLMEKPLQDAGRRRFRYEEQDRTSSGRALTHSRDLGR